VQTYFKVYFTSLAFLSRLPIPASWQSTDKVLFARIPSMFWLAGLTLGCVIALAGWLLQLALPVPVAMAALVGLQLVLTGAFHEDGFADVADAMGGNTRERCMEIMADSRLGTFGVGALISLSLLRWVTYQQVMLSQGVAVWIFWIVIISALLRWVTVVLLKTLPYLHPSGKGIGRSLEVPTWRWMALPPALLLGVAVFIDWKHALLAAAGLGLIVLAAHRFFRHWLGGANGDCLGAGGTAAEIILLLTICA
jgi:adenosylcobinamide-GDP ribazoletransferase